MIFSVVAAIKDIVELGRDYPWPRPEACLRCMGRRIWGHGYVPAFFDGFSEGVLLRRYRCPECRCVMKARPEGYFTRFQTSISVIRESIAVRLESGFWPRDPLRSRSRRGHWLRALFKNVCGRLGLDWKDRLVEGFDRLMEMARIPVTRGV